jgi:hypothetical protein
MDVILRWRGLIYNVSDEEAQRAVSGQNCLSLFCPDERGVMVFPVRQVWPSGSNRAKFYGRALSVLF